MFFSSSKRRSNVRRSRRSGCQHASSHYAVLEPRQLLTFLPPPVMTTNVADYATTVDDAIVRVDNQRLVIRTTGQENQIEVRLDQGFIQVNPSSRFSTALQIDPTQYQRIVMIGGGEDQVRVWGSDLTAQMHPDRLWVSGESLSVGGSTAAMTINGSDFEHVTVNDSGESDVGPALLHSNNRIRMHGSSGVERLDMSSKNNFSVKTSVTLTGDDFYFSANAFEDLYVNGRGGDDFASLAGTRGFNAEDFPGFLSASNGNDTYTGRDDWSRIRNDLWDARFVNFETQRVDLLSGNDSALVEDTTRSAAWYRVVGDDLVGAYRRLTNIEAIQITGSEGSTEAFVDPINSDGSLSEEADAYVWAGARPTAITQVSKLAHLGEVFPATFNWKFESFDRLV